MGKRQRRRNRQQRKNSSPKPQRYLVPNAETPLVEVHFAPGISEDDKAMCLRYWEFDEPGTWTHRVAALGAPAHVQQTLRTYCCASLLTVVCPDCSAPLTVTTRSEMTATRLWRRDAFPTSTLTSSYPCSECREAAAEVRRQEQQRAAAQQRADEQRAEEERKKNAEERVANASAWLEAQAGRAEPERFPEPRDALALLALVEVMLRSDAESFGPYSRLGYTLGESVRTDEETLRELFRLWWLVPTLPATTGEFAFYDDNTVEGVYLDRIPLRLAPALGENTVGVRRHVAGELRRFLLARPPAELAEIVADLETAMAVAYLDYLLVSSYEEEPVPEHRVSEAHEICRNTLRDGFTFGQLLAVIWSSTASAVAWGQRTPGLKSGSVSSAAVTTLGRRVDSGRDRALPEYDLPNAVPRPATYATALRLLAQHEAEREPRQIFQSLQRRLEARAREALELDTELAAAAPDSEQTASAPEQADPTAGPDGSGGDQQAPALTYAVVSADGTLEFRTDLPEVMMQRISAEAGADAELLDQVVLDEPMTINAYLAEEPTGTGAAPNSVAYEMFWLLGQPQPQLAGPVAFVGVEIDRISTRSLDEEHQALLRTAHQIAEARVDVGRQRAPRR
ncbi:hypothetical protein [Saccharopolyspora sp. NPDC002376]